MSKLPPMRFTPAEDLFNMGEAIDYLYISQLETFRNHPFSVTEDKEMQELAESIKLNGVITPIVVREIENDKYEIISGHRRTHASKLAGLLKVPCIIKKMTDEEAIIAMVDANKQRENIKPSEKAFAYKMKMEAMNKQGKRTDLTSCQVGAKLRTDEQIAADSEDSARQIQRFIRLTNLIPKLLHEVDIGNIKLVPGVELSYLSHEAQENLLLAMEVEEKSKISNSTAKKLRAAFNEGKYSLVNFCEILSPSDAHEENYYTLTLKIEVPYKISEKVQSEDLKRICDNYIKSLELKINDC